ncbi:hypothetical protein LF845_09345 [Deferribacterales bacterium Es71-Z0220]|uniref:GAF domain-containing protein n=1 Tax=Deferrivibrio essentukiensis TaxID=2880922 RepID=UPI001F60A437|nr:GAF domain-containing protein [Deferrivibrio essentukiensis]MCB4205161.1 hypothetical protein [Deferrivibrio essentukiensis]
MIPILLLSNNIDEIKTVSKICQKNNLMFIFVDNEEQFRNILLNEKIIVSIVNSSLSKEPKKLIEDLRESGCNTSFIYIGDKSFEKARLLLKAGFYDYLPHDYEVNELESSINEAVENVFAFEKIKSLSENLEQTNKDLVRKTQELENEKKNLSSHIETLSKIQKFVKEISINKDINQIVSITLKYLNEKFCDRIIFFTLIEDFTETIAGTCNISKSVVENITFDLKDLKASPWATIILEQKSNIYIEAPLEDEWYRESKIIPFFPYGFAKYPLVSRGKVFGTITIALKAGDKKELENDETFIFFLSEHAAIAIDNLKLHKELLDTIDNLKKTQEQLIEQEKITTLGKLAVSVNHEINNPLCSISLNIEILKRSFCDLNNEQVKKIFEAIEKNIDKISSITNKINNMKKIVTKEYLPGIEMLDFDNN